MYIYTDLSRTMFIYAHRIIMKIYLTGCLQTCKIHSAQIMLILRINALSEACPRLTFYSISYHQF